MYSSLNSLIILLTVLKINNVLCQWKVKAKITPKDTFVFVGETLELRCQMNMHTNLSLKDVHFNVVSTLNKLKWPVSREDYSINLDNRSVSVKVVVKSEFLSPTTIECLNGNNLLASTYIYTEMPLQKVTNFTAYYLYKDHVNVSWLLNQTYMNPSSIMVDVGWSSVKPTDNASSQDLIPCNVTSPVYCVINESSFMINFIKHIYVIVTVFINVTKNRPVLDITPSTIYPTRVTTVHEIYRFNATKSGPPLRLQLITVNSTCIHVSWSNPSYLNYSVSRQYVIQYVDSLFTSASRDQLSGQYNNKTLPVTICHLRPYTNYTVSVRLRATARQPWSDSSELTVHTDEDRPLAGPPLQRTSFHSTPCKEGKRYVFVYWQKPDSVLLQGLLTGFHVKITPDDGHYILDSSANHIRVPSLDCRREYHVTVFATTKAGRSLQPSFVLIPKVSKALAVGMNPTLEEMIDSSAPTKKWKNVTVSWDCCCQENVTLVLYRCQGYKHDLYCLNEYSFMEIDGSQGYIHLDNIPSDNDLFGLALQMTNGQTSGIEWIECYHNKNSKPEKIIDLKVTSGSDFGTLDILWSREPCKGARKLCILHYTVYVCDLENTAHVQWCRQYNVSGGARNLKVTSLRDDQEYYVTLRASTAHVTGDLSDFETSRTKVKKDYLSNPTIITTIMVVIGVLVICPSLVYFFWRCFKSRDRFSKMTQVFQWDNASAYKVKETQQISQKLGIVSDFPSSHDVNKGDSLLSTTLTVSLTSEQSRSFPPPEDQHSSPTYIKNGRISFSLTASSGGPALDYVRVTAGQHNAQADGCERQAVIGVSNPISDPKLTTQLRGCSQALSAFSSLSPQESLEDGEAFYQRTHHVHGCTNDLCEGYESGHQLHEGHKDVSGSKVSSGPDNQTNQKMLGRHKEYLALNNANKFNLSPNSCRSAVLERTKTFSDSHCYNNEIKVKDGNTGLSNNGSSGQNDAGFHEDEHCESPDYVAPDFQIPFLLDLKLTGNQVHQTCPSSPPDMQEMTADITTARPGKYFFTQNSSLPKDALTKNEVFLCTDTAENKTSPEKQINREDKELTGFTDFTSSALDKAPTALPKPEDDNTLGERCYGDAKLGSHVFCYVRALQHPKEICQVVFNKQQPADENNYVSFVSH